MISTWREFPPSPPRQKEPTPEPHIWDDVTVDQNASMAKSAEALKTTVTSIIDHLPAEQQSTFQNYQATRMNAGKEAKVL